MSLCSCFWAWKKNKTNDNEDHSTEDIELTTFNNHNNDYNNQRSSESLVGADHNQTSQSDDRRSPPITIDHHETPNTPFNIDHHEPAAKIPPITIDDPKLKSLAKNVRTVQASSSSSSSGPLRNPKEVISFTLGELASATNNYSDLLGEGGYGPVFKGLLTLNGSPQLIAVKTLNTEGTQGNSEFVMETIMLSHLQHPNLVNLIGFCAESSHRMLVYQYMANGSLGGHLSRPVKKRRLDWKKRMKIAAGAARGLEYLHLHANFPVIYRDMKPDNILLDAEFNPKLSDFGIAKMGPTGDQTHVTTRVMGTHGYCAPEYAKTGRLTFKSDVFSFGIVLLQLISGRPAVGPSDEDGETQWIVSWAGAKVMKRRADLTELVDPLLKGQYRRSSANKAVSMAVLCIQEFPRLRPSMTDVVACLDRVVARLDVPPDTTDQPAPSAISSSGEQRRLLLDRRKEKAKAKAKKAKAEDRERAVAEAKLWGQRFRRKNVPRINPPAPAARSPPSSSDDSDA